MIDNPAQLNELLGRLQQAMPLPAIISRRLAAMLRQRSPRSAIPSQCQVTSVSYAGDEGGIICQISYSGWSEEKELLLVSITHLEFSPRLPLAREIALYQKRRLKKLRQQAA